MLPEEMVTTPSLNRAAWAAGRSLVRVTINYENKGEEMLCWVSGEVMPRTEGPAKQGLSDKGERIGQLSPWIQNL